MSSLLLAAFATVSCVTLVWRLRNRAKAKSAHRAAIRWLRQSIEDRRHACRLLLADWPADAAHCADAEAARHHFADALQAAESCPGVPDHPALAPGTVAVERALSRAWERVLLTCESEPSLDAFIPRLESPTECHNRVAVAAALVRHTAASGDRRTKADRVLDLFNDPDEAWFALSGHFPTPAADRAVHDQVAQEFSRPLD